MEALTEGQIADIDRALLAEVSPTHWRKMARVIGGAMMAQPNRVPDIPDLYYAERLRQLIDAGRLQARGDPFRMGNCEVLLRTDRE